MILSAKTRRSQSRNRRAFLCVFTFTFLFIQLDRSIEKQEMEKYIDNTSTYYTVKDYEGKTMTMRKFPPGHRDFLKFTSVLRRNGALIEGIAGNARMLLIDVKKMFELGEKMLENDPDYFLCENDECAYCRGKKDARDNSAK